MLRCWLDAVVERVLDNPGGTSTSSSEVGREGVVFRASLLIELVLDAPRQGRRAQSKKP